jgi:tetratricopeptide (TPR) repeat protein
MASTRVLVVWSTVLPAAAMLAGCREAPAPPPTPVVATQPGAPAREGLHAAAEARRIGAFQQLRDAQEAERSGRLTEARNLYAQALELDPNNAAARDGRNRVIAYLEEAEKNPPPALSRTERLVVGSLSARWDFNFAVEEADKALALKRFAEARAARRRAWAAVERDRDLLAPDDLRAFQAAAEKLDRRITEAESAAASTAAPATRPTSHSH